MELADASTGRGRLVHGRVVAAAGGAQRAAGPAPRGRGLGPTRGVVRDIYAAPEGRPSYPPLLVVKVLLLQQWYNASDPEIEAALWDRLSFRRFVGLGLQDPVPDHSTISRFRTALATHGLGARLFAEVTRQLDAAGWLAGQGGHAAGRDAGGGAGAAAVDGRGAGGGQRDGPRRDLDAQRWARPLRLQGAPGRRCGVGADPAGGRC